jgi:hypothetical protein
VEWPTIISAALGGSPLAIVLGFACWALWQANQRLQTEISRLNDQRVKDLLEIAHRDD